MDKPVRKINNSGGVIKNTGFFPSLRNKRSIAYEYLLEKDYMYLLEFDRTVISYTEQPITLEYNYFKRKRTYTPDLKVVRQEKTQIIEVKPYHKLIELLNDEDKVVKFNVAANYCFQNQFEYKFVTDREIKKGSFLNNIKFLYRYSNVEVPAAEVLRIKNELFNNSLDINTLLSRIANSNNEKFKVYIFSLIFNQILKTNLDEPLSDASIVKL